MPNCAKANANLFRLARQCESEVVECLTIEKPQGNPNAARVGLEKIRRAARLNLRKWLNTTCLRICASRARSLSKGLREVDCRFQERKRKQRTRQMRQMKKKEQRFYRIRETSSYYNCVARAEERQTDGVIILRKKTHER